MKIKISKVAAINSCARQCLLDGNARTLAFGIRRTQVMGIRAFSPARQSNLRRFSRHQKQRAALAYVDPGPMFAERVATFARNRVEHRKSIEREPAQGIDPTGNDRVA